MTAFQGLNAWISLQFLCLLVVPIIFLGRWSLKKLKQNLSFKNELELHYNILKVIFLCGLALPFVPHQNFLEPAVKIWSEATLSNDTSIPTESLPTMELPQISKPLPKPDDFGLIFCIGLLLAFLPFLNEIRKLKKYRDESFLVRQIGSIEVLASDSMQTPISFLWGWHPCVILPMSLLSQKNEMRMALLHELQHHRQKDTQWIYLMSLLRCICFCNPALRLWFSRLSELQELACDEALIQTKKVKVQQYASFLVETAQNLIPAKEQLVCATGLFFRQDQKKFKRRIESMFSKSSNLKSKVGLKVLLILSSLSLGFATWAGPNWIQDRRITLEMATELAQNAQVNTPFPIVVNEWVLEQLNRYLGTPEGRRFLRESLQRMENYEAVIAEAIEKYNLPQELMAIPIVESGYQNLPQRPGRVKSAGLWQFIPSTARNFGLEVNPQKDQRLDVKLSTDAALRYLKSIQLRFQKWPLTILSYNKGEEGVQKAMEKWNSQDAWQLIARGEQGDKGYLAKVMAVMIIMKNPKALE